MSNKIIVMKGGRVVESGPREQVREGVVTHVLRIVTQLTLPVVE